MVRTFLKVYMELGSYFTSARTNIIIEDIIITVTTPPGAHRHANRDSFKFVRGTAVIKAINIQTHTCLALSQASKSESSDALHETVTAGTAGTMISSKRRSGPHLFLSLCVGFGYQLNVHTFNCHHRTDRRVKRWMADSWRIHGGFMADSWQIHVKQKKKRKITLSFTSPDFFLKNKFCYEMIVKQFF
jgi:hypothetical protein